MHRIKQRHCQRNAILKAQTWNPDEKKRVGLTMLSLSESCSDLIRKHCGHNKEDNRPPISGRLTRDYLPKLVSRAGELGFARAKRRLRAAQIYVLQLNE